MGWRGGSVVPEPTLCIRDGSREADHPWGLKFDSRSEFYSRGFLGYDDFIAVLQQRQQSELHLVPPIDLPPSGIGVAKSEVGERRTGSNGDLLCLTRPCR